MEFENRCNNDAISLLGLAREVFGGLPELDRVQVERVCLVVAISKSGPRATPGMFDPSKGEIRFNYYEFQKAALSLSRRRWIIAHEYGHAYDCAKRGMSAYIADGRLISDEKRCEGERKANEHAARWGFADDCWASQDECPPTHGSLGLPPRRERDDRG